MCTDIANPDTLKKELGTDAYLELVDSHDEMFQSALAEADDAELLNAPGDGFLVRFADAADAVNTALRFQYMLEKKATWSAPLRVRIGIQSGDEGKLAEQLKNTARPGQILIGREVFDDARQHVREHPRIDDESDLPPLVWLTHGEYDLEGNSLAICEVGAEGVAPETRPEGRSSGGADAIHSYHSLPLLPVSGNLQTDAAEDLDEEALRSRREKYEAAHQELESEIERLKGSRADMAAENEARVAELNQEAKQYSDEIVRLNEYMMESRRLLTKRLIYITGGSILLALVVGIFSAKVIWGAWPWQMISGVLRKPPPNMVIEGLKILEGQSNWAALLGESNKAARKVEGEEDLQKVKSFATTALQKLADPANRNWEQNPDPLMEELGETTKKNWELAPEHGFLVAKIYLGRTKDSPRLAGMNDTVDAYLAYQKKPADAARSEELDGDLNHVLGILLQLMDDAETVPDEDLIRELLAKLNDSKERLPRYVPAAGRLSIRADLREIPPDISGALETLNGLSEADETWRPLLQQPFQRILVRIYEQPGTVPRPGVLTEIGKRWSDSRAMVAIIENLEIGQPDHTNALRDLWELYRKSRTPGSDPLPDDSLAWVGWLSSKENDPVIAREGRKLLDDLSAKGNAKAKYVLVDHLLQAGAENPGTEEDLAKLQKLAEDALAGGESGATMLLGQIHHRLHALRGEDEKSPTGAPSLAASRKYYREAETVARRKSDREMATILLAATYGDSGWAASERPEIARLFFKAGLVLWQWGEGRLIAAERWNKAWESDREAADLAAKKAIQDAKAAGEDVLAEELEKWLPGRSGTGDADAN